MNQTNQLPTEELQALDAAHHMHPFTAGAELAKKGVRVIKSASGLTLTDSEGEQIMDGMAGLWCVNIGYGRTELAEAAYRQMQELPYYNTFFQSTHVPAVMLARDLADIAPAGFNQVFYAGSGSEANDTNIRLVRHYWASVGQPDKSVIISRKNAYHGSSVGSASLGGMTPMHKQGGLPIKDIVHIDQPDWWSLGGDQSPAEFGRLTALQLEQKIEELGEHRVAAFIAEPVQGAGGVIVPPETYWPEIQRICDAHEILLIADEVICGFGRTGNWFGSETMGIKPDIMTIAKGLSSGYAPIAGSLVSDHIAEVVSTAEEFNHGYTYSGHPVSAAVARENLRILREEKIVEHVREKAGPYLHSRWSELAEHPLVGEAKSTGLMASIVLTPDKARRAAFPGKEGAVGVRCREKSYANKLIMRAVGDRMVISPPLIIQPEEIDILIERVVQSLDETLAECRKEGLING